MLHGRLLEDPVPPLRSLAGALMGLIVLPFLGACASREELSRLSREAGLSASVSDAVSVMLPGRGSPGAFSSALSGAGSGPMCRRRCLSRPRSETRALTRQPPRGQLSGSPIPRGPVGDRSPFDVFVVGQRPSEFGVHLHERRARRARQAFDRRHGDL